MERVEGELRLGALLERLESWAEVRLVAALAQAEGGAAAFELARLLGLSEGEASALLHSLVERGIVVRRGEPSGEPRFRLAEAGSTREPGDPRGAGGSRAPTAALPATWEFGGRPDSPPDARPARLDPSPAAEGRDSRQVAADVSALYRNLFQRSPRLSWLLRQRRRAMELGEDFGQLLASVRAARPRGDPQAYLEAVLRRLERERGVSR